MKPSQLERALLRLADVDDAKAAAVAGVPVSHVLAARARLAGRSVDHVVTPSRPTSREINEIRRSNQPVRGL